MQLTLLPLVLHLVLLLQNENTTNITMIIMMILIHINPIAINLFAL